jgi:pimeloyl-ACP methyl ester carboxylesterase
MTEISDHFADVEGVRLHWAEVGEASGAPPVVLIHGLTNSCRSWSQTAPLLATDRRVLMPDLPGHGQSQRPDADYALHWYARVIARWLELLRIEQADVVGHSFGGGVAQMLLLECPERIRRLVLVAAGGLGKGVGWWLRLASLPGVVEYLGQPFMAVGTRLALSSDRDGMPPEEIRELSRLNAQSGSARALARSIRDVIDWRGQRRNFRDRAYEIGTLPAILLIWGDRDAIIPIEQGRAFAESLAGVVFKTFRGVGHYPHNERPEAFVRTLRDFLDDPAVTATRLGLQRDGTAYAPTPNGRGTCGALGPCSRDEGALAVKELDIQNLGQRERELLELSFQSGSKEKRVRNAVLSALMLFVGLLLFSSYGVSLLALTAIALVIVVVSAIEKISYAREIVTYKSLVRALVRRLEEAEGIEMTPSRGHPAERAKLAAESTRVSP